jgi:hypothetical protein
LSKGPPLGWTIGLQIQESAEFVVTDGFDQMMIGPGGQTASSIFLLSIALDRVDQAIFTAFLLATSRCDVMAAHPRKAKVEQNQLGPVDTCDFDRFGVAAISPKPHRRQSPLRYSWNRPADAGSNAIIAINRSRACRMDSSRLSTEGLPSFVRVSARGLRSQS